MKYLAWNDCFNTGFDEVDRQHRHLFDRINEVAPLLARAGDEVPDCVADLLDQLHEYASTHFATEELLMSWQGVDYRFFTAHRASHQRFIAEVGAMMSAYLNRTGVSGRTLLEFVTNWVVFHILGEDQELARQLHCIEQGITSDIAFETGNSRAIGPSQQALSHGLMNMFTHFSVKAERHETMIGDLDLRNEMIAEYTCDWETWHGADGTLRYCSPACLRITGHDRNEFFADLDLLLKIAHPDDVAILADHLTDGFDKTGWNEMVFRICRADGEWRWLEHICQPVFDDSGQFQGRRGSNRDVTDRIELARQLADALALAEKSAKAKSEFLSNMSHEIRTPLNAIIGLSHLLQKSPLADEQRERLTRIDTSAYHLLAIINDILDLSKIEAGRMTLEETDFTIDDILDYTRELIAEAAAQKDLRVSLDRDSVPIRLRGDPTRLRQGLLNYASNAIKFTERGQVQLSAQLISEDDDDAVMVRFQVEDSGIGIAPDTLAKLFQPFQQGDANTSRKFGGTGLGLVITRHLARLMGGDAGASSEVGRGSIFWFSARLRRAQAPRAECVEGLEQDAAVVLRERHAGARILLVEDEPINREVALDILQEVGLSVDFACDGREAVELARANDYRLILMDMLMPEVDGLAATRSIRALPDRGKVPILAMTANAYESDKRACLDAGMNDHIAKPVDPQKLYETVLGWLEKSTHKVTGC
jgi:hemerythrin-like metal-binding protein/PAS domain S-box-containing protein